MDENDHIIISNLILMWLICFVHSPHFHRPWTVLYLAYAPSLFGDVAGTGTSQETPRNERLVVGATRSRRRRALGCGCSPACCLGVRSNRLALVSQGRFWVDGLRFDNSPVSVGIWGYLGSNPLETIYTGYLKSCTKGNAFQIAY